jgi:DNA-binding response OmpR family regulator
MDKETILVIDDSIELQRILSDFMLGPLGYHILRAGDGKTGLAMVEKYAPDLIMLDMHMPRMDGLGVLKALYQANSKIPVIFMTVHGSEKLATETFRLGVRDYLIKPFSVETAQAAVDQALQETRLEREKERLSRNLLAAETVRQTVTTLSHHINNQLMVVSGSLSLLQEALEQESRLSDRDNLLEMVENSTSSIIRIERVLKTLQKLNKIEPTAYHNQLQMIDIESILQQTWPGNEAKEVYER